MTGLSRTHSQNVLSILTVYSKYTTTLTFEIFFIFLFVSRTDAGGVVASSKLGQTIGLGHCHEGVTDALASIESAGYRFRV